MKKGFLVLIGLAIAVLILCAVFFAGREGYTGTKDFGDDSMSMEFTQMTGTDSHTMSLQSGDTLHFSYEIRKGSFAVTVALPGEEPVYSADSLGTGGFLLDMEQEGEYLITVTARNAKGRFAVERTKEN